MDLGTPVIAGQIPEEPSAARSDRITTGVRQADLILGGGFPANTINMVMGQPGTGKTVFVEQLLFANASPERPALYLTTLSEPLAKVVRFVQDFEFYDPAMLGTAVLYDDIGTELATAGPASLVPRIKQWIKEYHPGLIVIDSFRALHDISESVVEMRHLVHDLTGLLTAYDTTTFLVGEYREEDIHRYPEFAVVDSVVQLSRLGLSARDERFFRVLKLRGSRYLEGAHAFRITSAGLDVFARLVTPPEPTAYPTPAGRVPSGVPGLDELLHGGLPAGTSTLVSGPSGSGKTTLALQFALEGLRRGEPCVYVSFQENPTQLRRTVARLSGEPAGHEGLELIYASPVELQVDRIVAELFDLMETRGSRRVAIDAVGDLAAATTDQRRLHDYLYALLQHMAVNNVTSMLTVQADREGAGEPAMLSLTDNVVVLGLSSPGSARSIRVVKARATAHDEGTHPMTIETSGLRIG